MLTAPRTVGRFDWPTFVASLKWRQGEHVTLLGPTGAGKTTLALELLPLRKWVMVFGTKPRDPSLDRLKREYSYEVARSWPPPAGVRRVILWPDVRRMGAVFKQQDVFAEAMEHIYEAGGWCIYMDELRYVTSTLKLAAHTELLWQQGRSLGVSLVGGTQRPAKVPLEAYDQATHLFLWRDSDKRNLDRLADISGDVDRDLIRATVTQLGRHEVLYVDTRTGRLAVTQAPAP